MHYGLGGVTAACALLVLPLVWISFRWLQDFKEAAARPTPETPDIEMASIVAAFVLADGRTVGVKGGWWGALAERNFLRDVHRGACDVFTTVLGPAYDINHRDHFHLDLARHARDGENRICK